MSSDVNWNIDQYREAHESEEHWDLRRKFLERWKDDYPEERLVCLARVFANIELLGCRYPQEVMQEVARLSTEVAKSYRQSRKNKLKRTFVSASEAAEDRAKGIRRLGGIIVEGPPPKTGRIQFVRPGQACDTQEINSEPQKPTWVPKNEITESIEANDIKKSVTTDPNEYLKDITSMQCLDARNFNEQMFQTEFGRMVLLVRPWTSKYGNLQSSCQVCNIALSNTYKQRMYSLFLNGKLIAQAFGANKAEAKATVEALAWNRITQSCVCVLVKEQFIAQGEARISMNDVTSKREQFGTPLQNSVAAKMMKLMGWKGGGLGADAQGIAEPIKPHLQMVDRSGLGSQSMDVRQLRRAGQQLMQRYIATDTLDVDLVFSSEFSKEERAELHQIAQRAGLASRSYGDIDRFLVVKKKLDPFSLVRAVLDKGGNTPKYQVFIPAALARRQR